MFWFCFLCSTYFAIYTFPFPRKEIESKPETSDVDDEAATEREVERLLKEEQKASKK